MVRRDLMSTAAFTRKRIERVLATSGGKGLTLSEISMATGLSPATVKRHLEKLIAIGRVDVEYHRGSPIYYFNGHEKYQEKVRIGNKIIYIDLMINPWGRPFIRIKEAKKDPRTGEYETKGSIIIDPDIVTEFIKKLKKVSENAKIYGK